MPQSEPSWPHIELDPGDAGLSNGEARRLRSMSQVPVPPSPPLVPALPPGGVGSDEAERAVGYLLLLSALPVGISLLAQPGIMGMVFFVVPVYLGIGLLRKDDFVIRWVTFAYALTLVRTVLLALAGQRSVMGSLGSILAAAPVLLLLSGKGLKRRTYRICLGAILLGSLVGVIGALREMKGCGKRVGSRQAAHQEPDPIPPRGVLVRAEESSCPRVVSQVLGRRHLKEGVERKPPGFRQGLEFFQEMHR